MSDQPAIRAHVRTPETDEVLRRVGRNVVIFQQVESLLKHLMTYSAFGGPVSVLWMRLDKHAADVHKKTMGELAGRLLDNVLRPEGEQVLPEAVDEIWFSFRFSIDADAVFVDRHDEEMRALVDARNNLIHHFLPRWQSAIDGDTDGALAHLDAQRDDAVRVMERLRGWVASLDAGRKQVAESWSSPDGQRQFELAVLRGSRLVLMLGEMARAHPAQMAGSCSRRRRT